jgi:hypothetical protein
MEAGCSLTLNNFMGFKTYTALKRRRKPSVTLVVNGTALNWSYNVANPTTWSVQQSDDGVSGWTQIATVTAVGVADGSTFSYGTLTHTKYYTIIGLDANGAYQTEPSNVIQYP